MGDKICRKKMHKSGKQWLVVGLTVASVVMGVTTQTNILADSKASDTTDIAEKTTAKIGTDTIKSITDNSGVTSTENSSSSAASAGSSAAVSSAASASSSAADASSSAASAGSSAAVSSAASASSSAADASSSAADASSSAAVSSAASASSSAADASSSAAVSSAASASSSAADASSSVAVSSAASASSTATSNNKDNLNAKLPDNQVIKQKDTVQLKKLKNLKSGRYITTKNGLINYRQTNGKLVKGLVKINGHVQYFDQKGNQVKNKIIKIKGVSLFFDKKSGNLTTGVIKIAQKIKAFNSSTGQQVVSAFYKDTKGNKYYFDTKGDAKIGLTKINGALYYFDKSAHLRTNYSAVLNGQVLYFNKAGKAIDDNTLTIKQGLTVNNSDYTQHNQVFDTTKASVENVDTYLTAAAWYRPKEILNDGTTWTASNSNDYRPILMSWWPDTQTKVNYLNYMKDLGFINNNTDFKTGDTEDLLRQATESVQANIEKKIAKDKSVTWLRSVMDTFVKTQVQWNSDSEDLNDDHLQGGALSYINSPLTLDANSDFRLMNRTPTNQTGKQAYTTDNSLGGYELLLANDVDNSNPVVQAEDLNWLYYLLNLGTILKGDSDANFDSVRVDAVDNVDADLLQIVSQYMADAYKTNESDANANAHLSILEDWSYNDAQYQKDNGASQLTINNHMHTQMIYSLTKDPSTRSSMKRFLEFTDYDRSNDSTENIAIPNYAFVRAHDSEVQTVIAQIIKDLYPNSGSGLIPTTEEIAKAFEVYNKDEKSVNKKYTHYNIPSSYAYMLTSKDTVPRVYYGDLYTDNGQYMETQTPYFKAISNLLKLRVKYVSGGETQNVDGNDILTQVRFGNGAMKVTDKGTRATRTQGVGVIIANNPKLILKKGQTVVLHMGAAHKNQLFRAAVLTTKNGLKVYASDQNAPTMRTNSKGDLIFNSSSIYGVAQVEVSGYLAVWVPVGASEKQDARTKATQAKNKDGQVLHSNAALDSNLIYEGFSNFQAFASKKSEYTNVKIAKNAQLFKSWGVTSFQLAPQYKSSTDTSFLDSIIANGYAFTDRYNVGQDGATKYGDLDDLVNAIKALHGSGIQVMADFVPDQIYNLPNQQVVAVNRTNAMGDVDQNSDLQNVLYASNTQSSGKDYQSIYGGAFLTKIKKLYPDLFTTKQVSTGKSIDASQVIKQWEAKYFNGSNVQGKGIGYVLKDSATGQYFKVTANSAETAFLPLQLTNELSNTGFYSDSTGIAYYDTSGYHAKNAFIEGVNGNWYYFDKDGYMIFGSHKIKENYYYFLPNGHELRSSFLTDEKNNTYYYNAKGKRVVNQYVSDDQGNYYYFGSNGKMIQGLVAINDSYHKTQYFYASGIQAKDVFIKDKKGNIRYFDKGSGNMLVAQFKQTPAGKWMYFKNNGVAAKGYLKLGNTTYYFDQNGFQKKDYYTGKFYFDKKLGKKVVSSYVYTNKLTSKHQYHWYYLNAQGVAKVLQSVTKKELVNVKNNAQQVKVSRDNLNKLLQKLTQNSVKNHKKIKLTKQQLSKFKLKYQRLVHQNKILNKLYKINTTKLTLKNTNRLAKISKKKLDTLAKKIKQEQKSLRNLTSKAKKAKLRLVIKKNQKVFQKERKVYVRLKQKAVRVRLMPVISDYW